METAHFDALSRRVSTLLTRRTLASALGLAAFGLPGLAGTKKTRKKRKHKHKHKKKKRVTFNDFGCVDIGNFCQNVGQCCSGICEGKKDKKTCRAHDVSTCEAEQTGAICGGMSVTCTNVEGGDGTCYTTTGNAPYCSATGNCFPCARDADCIPFCGPGAACIPCAAFCPTERTMCAGPSIIDTCEFPS